MIRRVLGKILIQQLCPVGRPWCEDRRALSPSDACKLALTCPYGVLFAQSYGGRPPFALSAPILHGEQVLEELELALFGPATGLARPVVRSLAQALRDGLGAARERFAVESVSLLRHKRDAETICDGDLRQMPETLESSGIEVEIPELQVSEEKGLVVELTTPTRLKHRKKLLIGDDPVSLDILVGRCLDRLEGVFGKGASPALEPAARAELLQRAEAVPLVEGRLQWIEVRDWSTRQRREMLIGGKVGSLTYGPGAAAFRPILKVGSLMLIGKNTASGCGRLRVSSYPIPAG